jgi:uroporphyrin-III C-methyltransferase / precorrin-2 dehydrogenase / sirohydrochlorin ferrochelatase
VRYPLFLDLTGRRVVVVGGGAVAVRRTKALQDAGAQVVVIAPTVSDDLAAAEVHRRRFEPADVDGAWLVLACTDDDAVNGAVASAAAQRGIWCARADRRDESAAWVPAAGVVDDVQIAVTGGWCSSAAVRAIRGC